MPNCLPCNNPPTTKAQAKAYCQLTPCIFSSLTATLHQLGYRQRAPQPQKALCMAAWRIAVRMAWYCLLFLGEAGRVL